MISHATITTPNGVTTLHMQPRLTDDDDAKYRVYEGALCFAFGTANLYAPVDFNRDVDGEPSLSIVLIWDDEGYAGSLSYKRYVSDKTHQTIGQVDLLPDGGGLDLQLYSQGYPRWLETIPSEFDWGPIPVPPQLKLAFGAAIVLYVHSMRP